MFPTIRHLAPTQSATAPTSEALSTAATGKRSAVRARVGLLLAVALTVLAVLVPAGAANATVRLPNGAYGSYGLDCSGYHSARLTVQGGANEIPVDGFHYWVYNVDTGQYVVNGAWVANGTGWNTTTITATQVPGRYNIYVQYWSYTGGSWYTGGEWTWATNLVQPTSSQTCIVL